MKTTTRVCLSAALALIAIDLFWHPTSLVLVIIGGVTLLLVGGVYVLGHAVLAWERLGPTWRRRLRLGMWTTYALVFAWTLVNLALGKP